MELSVLSLNLHTYQQPPRHSPWDNAPAGGNEYQHVVGNEEYVDQFHVLHPHRFFEPTYRGKIDGWEYSEPKRIDYVFKRNGCPLHIKHFQLIFNDHFFPMVSDHFGLLTHIELS